MIDGNAKVHWQVTSDHVDECATQEKSGELGDWWCLVFCKEKHIYIYICIMYQNQQIEYSDVLVCQG
jgi:hypothetical protein